MQYGEKLSLEQIRAFLDGSGEVRFQAYNRRELYEWVSQTLRQYNYGHLKREGKGLVRLYVSKMTGLSRAQGSGDWGAPPAQSAGPAGISASGYSAPRRLGWGQGFVSHQCGG